MKPESKYPNFDCLKYKEEVQRKIYEETKDMSLEEWNAYHEQRIASDPFWSAFVRKLTKKTEDNSPVIPLPKKAAVA